MDLLTPITNFPGVGEKTALKLAKLGISTPYDLLTHLPSRYLDRTKLSSAAHCQPGEEVCLQGILSPVKNQFTKSGKFIQMATFTDASGTLPVIWFNHIFLSKNHRIPKPVALFGKVDFFIGKKITLISPEIEYTNELGFVPIYPETAGLNSKWLRNKIKSLIPILPENPIPIESPIWKESISSLHFPINLDLLDYKTRLELDELLVHILSGMTQKEKRLEKQNAPVMQIDQKKLKHFISTLSFTLTPSQNQSIQEILFDLTRNISMNRLLEGDVGSGKTIVAAIAAYIAHLNGYRTLFLAPTQILANQHYQTLSKLFDFEIGLYTASQKKFNSPIIVGTHALINKVFAKVGLVIIDEQHKFGVLQRSKLATTHTLTMTATPIPRSIALTLYGDLDLSVLNRHREPNIKTWLVPEEKRNNSYTWIKDQIHTHKSQTFIVCPFVDISESSASVKSAIAEYDRLKKVFSPLRLGLLHGRLKSAEKDTVMSLFKNHLLDILVCTPVVEVGIDISNTTIIIIEDADRFGLAQLHQLRGRVGRGELPSYCLLYSTKDTQRLEVLTKTQSGLELAEADLKLRGPGQIYGTLQHGFIPFRVASFANPDLILKARALAESLLPDLPKYPFLKRLVDKVKIPEYDTSS